MSSHTLPARASPPRTPLAASGATALLLSAASRADAARGGGGLQPPSRRDEPRLPKAIRALALGAALAAAAAAR
jgi:hypothetical protein